MPFHITALQSPSATVPVYYHFRNAADATRSGANHRLRKRRVHKAQASDVVRLETDAGAVDDARDLSFHGWGTEAVAMVWTGEFEGNGGDANEGAGEEGSCLVLEG